MKKSKTELFIEKATKKFGSKFGYTKVSYVNRDTKISIDCPIHSEISIPPSAHLNTVFGCILCRNDSLRKSKEAFIRESSQIHGDRYDYSNVAYTNNRNKVSIVCRDHGAFMQSPSKHLSGRGCPMCANWGNAGTVSRVLEALEGGIKLENPSDLNTINDLGVFTCVFHGSYSKKVKDILRSPRCPQCSRESLMKPAEVWLGEFKDKHGDRYDYSKFIFSGTNRKGTVICNRHGAFQIDPSHHTRGSGCRDCAYEEATYDSLKMAYRKRHIYKKSSCYLYFIKMYDESKYFYKVGISKIPKDRFSALRRDSGMHIEALHIEKSNRYDCVLLENSLHKRYSSKRSIILDAFAGYTECFDLSIRDIVDIKKLIKDNLNDKI